MIAIVDRANARTLLTLGCLSLALLGQPAFAFGGGTPDPNGIPVLQAMRTQAVALDRSVLQVTGIVDPQDLPILQKLADDLARIDAQFAIAAAGGDSGGPMDSTLYQALVGLRAEAAILRAHLASVLARIGTVATFAEIARTLRYMEATAATLTARIDYALP